LAASHGHTEVVKAMLCDFELIQTDKMIMAKHRWVLLRGLAIWRLLELCYSMAELIQNDKTSEADRR